jgi:hypothetical protein
LLITSLWRRLLVPTIQAALFHDVEAGSNVLERHLDQRPEAVQIVQFGQFLPFDRILIRNDNHHEYELVKVYYSYQMAFQLVLELLHSLTQKQLRTSDGNPKCFL